MTTIMLVKHDAELKTKQKHGNVDILCCIDFALEEVDVSSVTISA